MTRQLELYKLTDDEIRKILWDSKKGELESGYTYEQRIVTAQTRKLFKYMDMVKGYYHLPADDPYIRKDVLVTFLLDWWEQFKKEIMDD